MEDRTSRIFPSASARAAASAGNIFGIAASAPSRSSSRREELLAQHLLELRQRQAVVFGAYMAQHCKGPLVHPRSRHADVDQAANGRLAQATLGKACLEFGDALLDEGDPLRFDAGMPARGFIRGAHSDECLQHRRAVETEEDLLHGVIAQIAIAVEGGDDPVRDRGLQLEQRIVG